MKKTLTVSEIRRRRVSVEVDFPVYRKHDLALGDGEHIVFTRWGADNMECTVQRNLHGNEVEYQIRREPCRCFSEKEDPEYVLGQGDYQCTEDEFNAVLAEAEALIATIRAAGAATSS